MPARPVELGSDDPVGAALTGQGPDLTGGHCRSVPGGVLRAAGSRPAAAANSGSITLAHDLNVVIKPGEIAVRPLTGRPRVRHIQAAYLPGERSPARIAALNALRRIGCDQG